MEIRWDVEAVSGGLGCVRSALERLEACLSLSNAARESMIDARPTSDDPAINTLIEKFETTVRHLRVNEAAIEAIAHGLDASILNYEDAEDSVGQLINRVFTGRQDDIFESVGGGSAVAPEVAFEPWIPTPLILPDGMNRNRPIPGWLEPLLRDSDQLEGWI